MRVQCSDIKRQFSHLIDSFEILDDKIVFMLKVIDEDDIKSKDDNEQLQLVFEDIELKYCFVDIPKGIKIGRKEQIDKVKEFQRSLEIREIFVFWTDQKRIELCSFKRDVNNLHLCRDLCVKFVDQEFDKTIHEEEVYSKEQKPEYIIFFKSIFEVFPVQIQSALLNLKFGKILLQGTRKQILEARSELVQMVKGIVSHKIDFKSDLDWIKLGLLN